MRGYRFAPANGIDALIGLAFDAHPAGVDPQRLGEPQLNRLAMRSNLGALENDDDVYVLDN